MNLLRATGQDQSSHLLYQLFVIACRVNPRAIFTPSRYRTFCSLIAYLIPEYSLFSEKNRINCEPASSSWPKSLLRKPSNVPVFQSFWKWGWILAPVSFFDITIFQDMSGRDIFLLFEPVILPDLPLLLGEERRILVATRFEFCLAILLCNCPSSQHDIISYGVFGVFRRGLVKRDERYVYEN